MRIAVYAFDGITMFHLAAPLLVFGEVGRQGLATRRARRSRLAGQEQRQTLQLLREEQPNIRAALAFLSRPDGDRDGALMRAGSLGMFWHLGRHLEGREVLSRLVARHEGSPAARALALQAVSIAERPRGCLVHPHPRCAEAAAEEQFIDDGDPWGPAVIGFVRMETAIKTGDVDAAVRIGGSPAYPGPDPQTLQRTEAGDRRSRRSPS